MWKILMRINKNLIYAIPLFMLGGFLFVGLIGTAEADEHIPPIKDGVKN